MCEANQTKEGFKPLEKYCRALQWIQNQIVETRSHRDERLGETGVAPRGSAGLLEMGSYWLHKYSSVLLAKHKTRYTQFRLQSADEKGFM